MAKVRSKNLAKLTRKVSILNHSSKDISIQENPIINRLIEIIQSRQMTFHQRLSRQTIQET